MKPFDIAVIGGGPGGYVAAIRAAQKGACVCLVERDKVGGTCLNRGCIPTKALYSTARMLHGLRRAPEHGIGVGEVSFDFTQAARRKDQVVDKLVGGVEQLLKGNGVEVFRGEASLEGEGGIRIRRPGLSGHVRARNIILATGSLEVRPGAFPFDGKNVLTSRELLGIKERPKSLLIVGGGYIGCEFASIFSAFGTEVVIVEQLPVLLARSDRQAVREIEKTLKENGVAIHTATTVEALEVGTEGVTARLSGDRRIVAEKVLVAVGRVPNSAGYGFEEADIRMAGRAVAVNERMQTSRQGVYAIGDLTDIIQLAHVASYQGGIAVDNALGHPAKADYRVVPSAIFTFPELAEVGLNEDRCKEQGLACKVGRFAYQASSKALCDGEPRGMVKIVTGAEGEILGGTVVGEEASNLVAEIAAAMQGKMTAAALGKIIHAHPTLPEMIQEAAEDVSGEAVHKVTRRKPSEPREG